MSLFRTSWHKPSRVSLGRVLTFGFALALAAVGSSVTPREANASVSIAVAYDALVKDADAVSVATPMETKSVWENGRIYTYTRVHVDQAIAGGLVAGSGGWIRTMGGVVGTIGQLVDGEPVFTVGKPSLVFLRRFDMQGGRSEDLKSALAGTWEVSARAQGQYPVVVDDGGGRKRLLRSTAVGVLFPPKALAAAVSGPTVGGVSPLRTPLESATLQAGQAVRLAGDAIHERRLEDVAKELAIAWKRLHSDAKSPAVKR